MTMVTTHRQPPGPDPGKDDLLLEGPKRAVDLLHRLAGPDGFMASDVDEANYRRVWARDSIIIGLAALCTGEAELLGAFRRSLLTLAENQGPHGEIPSNVDTGSGRVSYGGMAGRVDADLWFIIGCGQYWRRTREAGFLGQVRRPMERAWWLLGAWQFNNRGLLYIPETGDWADEYLQEGYVLYDQVLYYLAGQTMLEMRTEDSGGLDHMLTDKLDRLRQLVRANYWFEDGDGTPPGVYHDVLYRKSKNAAERCRNRYWLPFFTPHGYGYRFDALANVLVSLLGLSCEERVARVDAYVMDEIWSRRPGLLPAFHPVIEPVDKDWEELKMTFSYTFKNRPYEYHNGGLWPMITGFYVADLARRGRHDLARRLLHAIHRANASEYEGSTWSFPEYLNGKTRAPGGTPQLGWSAAASLLGHYALEGDIVFQTDRTRSGLPS